MPVETIRKSGKRNGNSGGAASIAPQEISSMDMLEIAQALLLKNRTIVSRDYEEAVALLASEIPLEIHRYPSGADYGTWIVPPQWDVIKAELTDGAEVIASYRDHPLFLAPY